MAPAPKKNRMFGVWSGSRGRWWVFGEFAKWACGGLKGTPLARELGGEHRGTEYESKRARAEHGQCRREVNDPRHAMFSKGGSGATREIGNGVQ